MTGNALPISPRWQNCADPHTILPVAASDAQPDPEDHTISAYRLSRFLSRVALFAAIIGVCVYYYQIPPMGFEGIVFVSSVAVVLALLAGGMSLTLAAYLLFRHKRPKPLNAVLVSTIAIVIALTYVWAL